MRGLPPTDCSGPPLLRLRCIAATADDVVDEGGEAEPDRAASEGGMFSCAFVFVRV